MWVEAWGWSLLQAGPGVIRVECQEVTSDHAMTFCHPGFSFKRFSPGEGVVQLSAVAGKAEAELA